MLDQPLLNGGTITTTLGDIDHSAEYRLLCSLNRLPDMISLPHQVWLESRGTVTMTSFNRPPELLHIKYGLVQHAGETISTEYSGILSIS